MGLPPHDPVDANNPDIQCLDRRHNYLYLIVRFNFDQPSPTVTA